MRGNLELQGYQIVALDNLAARPTAWFKHKDGRVVELPADSYCLNYYLTKGLVLVNNNSENESPEAVTPQKVGQKRKKRKSKGGKR